MAVLTHQKIESLKWLVKQAAENRHVIEDPALRANFEAEIARCHMIVKEVEKQQTFIRKLQNQVK